MKCSGTLLILVCYILCISCSNISTEHFKHNEVQNHLSDQELDEIRSYVEQFQFQEDSERLTVYPEKLGPLVQEAIHRAAKINEKRHLPYAALFVLRLYHEKMKRAPKNYFIATLTKSNLWSVEGNDSLVYEFARIAILPASENYFYDIPSCYNWIKKRKSNFSDYPPISRELNEIEQLKRKLEQECQEIAAKFGLKELEHFAMEAPVIENGWAPATIPEGINRILEKLREHNRMDHLPYLLEYGLNLYLKNLTHTHLARVLPVDKNLMLLELIRLTKIPKYTTAHEAGWLNSQFYGSFEDIDEATGYSSYQVYIWYLESWSLLLDMPNIDRLCDIQKQIEKTGMQGVGGGLVCHYGCR